MIAGALDCIMGDEDELVAELETYRSAANL